MFYYFTIHRRVAAILCSVSVSVCLSVCLPASIFPELGLHSRRLPIAHVTYSRGSVFRFDMLCTSGVVTDVMGHTDWYRCSEWRHYVVLRRLQRRCCVVFVVSYPRYRWMSQCTGCRSPGAEPAIFKMTLSLSFSDALYHASESLRIFQARQS